MEAKLHWDLKTKLREQKEHKRNNLFSAHLKKNNNKSLDPHAFVTLFGYSKLSLITDVITHWC